MFTDLFFFPVAPDIFLNSVEESRQKYCSKRSNDSVLPYCTQECCRCYYANRCVSQSNATNLLLPHISMDLWRGNTQRTQRCLALAAEWPNNTGLQIFSPEIILLVQTPRLRHLNEKMQIPEAEHKIFIWRDRGPINFSYKCLQLNVVINNLPKAVFQCTRIVLVLHVIFSGNNNNYSRTRN